MEINSQDSWLFVSCVAMIYEYECVCSERVEMLRAVKDRDKPVLCPHCQRHMKRKMSVFSTQGLDHNVGS